jgi:hypothetical protein
MVALLPATGFWIVKVQRPEPVVAESVNVADVGLTTVRAGVVLERPVHTDSVSVAPGWKPTPVTVNDVAPTVAGTSEGLTPVTAEPVTVKELANSALPWSVLVTVKLYVPAGAEAGCVTEFSPYTFTVIDVELTKASPVVYSDWPFEVLEIAMVGRPAGPRPA